MILRYFTMPLLFLPLSVLSACAVEKEEPPRSVSLREFSEKFPVEVCEGSSIQTSNEISPELRGRWSVYIIRFRNVSCLHEFYDSAVSHSEINSNLDGRKYYRSQGVLKIDDTSYMINRLEDSKVSFIVRK